MKEQETKLNVPDYGLLITECLLHISGSLNSECPRLPIDRAVTLSCD